MTLISAVFLVSGFILIYRSIKMNEPFLAVIGFICSFLAGWTAK